MEDASHPDPNPRFHREVRAPHLRRHPPALILVSALGALAASLPVRADGEHSLVQLLDKEVIQPIEERFPLSLKVARVELAPGEGRWGGALADRWNSSDAFRGDFRREFLDGLAFYLRRSGFEVDSGADAVHVSVRFDHFEGRKRVNNDGGDLRGTLSLTYRGKVILTRPLSESLTYEDESDECPAFAKAYGLESVDFATVLFYRLSVSFYASIVDTLVDAKPLLLPPTSAPPAAIAKGDSLDDVGPGAAGTRVRRSAESPATASGVGFLTIESTPESAEVYLDGKLIATTPVQQARIPTGNYTLKLRKSGYQHWIRELMVLEHNHLTLKASLEKQLPAALPAFALAAGPATRATGETRIDDGVLDEIALKAAGLPANLPILIRRFSTEGVNLGTGTEGGKEKRVEAAEIMKKVGPGLLLDSLKGKLRDSARFRDVLDAAPAELPREYLIVEGKFLKINPGSRAKRYWGGYGAGKSGVQVAGVVKDAAGNVLAEFTHMRHSGVGLYGGDYVKFLSDDTRDVGADIGEFLVRWAAGENLSEDD